MLSSPSAPIVRDTLRTVGASLGTITELFYTRMFEERPDLLRTLFNRANQANGAQREALAGAVAAFATALVTHPEERPDAVLGRIANKHASLGITSEQYTLVGRHLLGAVKEVLGDAVTPAVAAAWDEVYWLMANALIAMEARLYAEAGVENGVVWRDMEVAERTEESPDTASFVLRRPDGLPTDPFLPGQYISVQVELPDGARQIRQYSLSTSPRHKNWRITVKRESSADGHVPEGEVSSWLHAHARAGRTLKVSLPFGDLVLLDGEGPLLLASAGIGITPMLSMLDHLASVSPDRPVVIIHADRSPTDHAHRLELSELVGRLTRASLHLWYENGVGERYGTVAGEPGELERERETHVVRVREGRADISDLTLPQNTTAFLCGPLPFMRTVRGDLLTHGLSPAAIHYEVFGPDLWLSK
ncbi:globin domain-containing protein [Streptomyces tsukubensis]|uniref:nitric oxide dioxygenase n=1 Tax=Streptomyces tsukubensis TaxID=83656 RepID=A0A1V4A8F1_9ACTN|nr:globin domain-containing protein [Streptomyces tsukubensis]OON78080.1 hemin transporter [Streptomyces tsukubensis]QFR98202.1 hemin transporter [Streptomyces tsukubensis]